MTREEAIAELNTFKIGAKSELGENALDMAIKALEQEPKYCDRNICIRNEHNGIGCGECEVTKSQEPCDDVISRQAVLDLCDMQYKYKIPYEYDDGDKHIKGYNEGRIINVTKLKKLQTVVTPQPKTGHWSRKTKVDAYDIAGVKTWGIKCQCDRCDFTTIVIEDFGYYKYCPNCGAKMVEPQESEVQNADSN